MIKDSDIVTINLKTKVIKREMVPLEWRKEYIGSIGINTKILYDSNAAENDAYSSENVLIFGVGPSLNTGLPAANRCTITAKSPLTDMYGDSNIGGKFNVLLRSLGIDHLVFTGQSEEPVYIYIDKKGDVNINDAGFLWGKDTHETTDILINLHGESCEVACIGRAGEIQARFANVMMSKSHAAGRMGMGGVMGNKRIKAIVLDKGNIKPDIYDRGLLKEIQKKWLHECNRSLTTRLGRVYGTLFLVDLNRLTGGLPINNSQTEKDEKSKSLTTDSFKANFQDKKTACYGCPVKCSKVYSIKKGKYRGESGERLEFGTVASIGPNIGIHNWDEVLHLKLLCDRIGVDTIEFSGAIGFLMELYQRGILTKDDFGGKEISFGSVDSVEYLTNLMLQQEGIGVHLKEGAYRLAEELDAQDYCFTVGKSYTGLLRNKKKLRTLGYLTSTRGGDHMKSFAFTQQNGGYYVAKHLFNMKNPKKEQDTPQIKGRVLWWHENYKVFVDAIGTCIFAMQGLPYMGVGLFDDFSLLMKALFGLNMDEVDVLKSCERIHQLQFSFNDLCGHNIETHEIPIRKEESDIDRNFINNTTINELDSEGMLPEYYKFRGFTKRGRPTKSKFLELNLAEYIEKAMVEDEGAVLTEDLLNDVNLTVNYNQFDKLYVRASSYLMGKALELRSSLLKRKYKD